MFKRPSSRKEFVEKTRQRLTVAMASPDLLIVQTVASIEELNKISNLMSERLTEWFGLHFPEFKTNDPRKYASVVLALDRSNPNEEALAAAIGNPESAKAILGRAASSSGVKFSEEDIAAVRGMARRLLDIYALKDELEAYSDSIANRICPNLSILAGPKLAAKLVAQAGSLQRLSTFPASTVQVLGAEKALFKHLKAGSKPPKHGVIFQHPLISTSPKKARGKIARALAGKLAIAVKADAITKHNIAEGLKQSFEARAKAIIDSEGKAREGAA